MIPLSLKNKRIRLYATIFAFVVFAGFLFFNVKTASAVDASSDTGLCWSAKPGLDGKGIFKQGTDDFGGTSSDFNVKKDDCINWCNERDPNKEYECRWNNTTLSLKEVISASVSNPLLNPGNSKAGTVIRETSVADKCGTWEWAKTPINCLLLIVLGFVGWLLSIAASIFTWVVDVNVFKAVVNGPDIYGVWQNVRDVLNIAFILVLLYSAFCTILQIEKYNYKKILLTLVIMALLVNFSFPITRFIIDVGNTLMYTLINNLLGGGKGTFAGFASYSQIGKILNQDSSSSAVLLLASILFVFILGITLLAIAIMMLIRMIALVILIIFSPLAFVGTILPGAGTYSSKWWDNLFRYVFFGPIMMFMLYVATALMKASASTGGILFEAASQQSGWSDLLTKMAYFAVPIVILWMGMGIAQSMSIAGAGVVMGGAQKFLGWAGRTFSGYRAGKWLVTKAAPYGIKSGLKKFERDVLAPRGLSPRAFIEGWKARTQEAEDKALKPAAGVWRDRLNKVLGGGETHFADAALQANILKKQKELSETSEESEYLMREFENAEKIKDIQKMAAVLRIMFNNNDQNEFMKLSGEPVEPEHMKKYIYDKLTRAGMSTEQTTKQLLDYSEIAFGKGNYGNFGMAVFDKELSKFRLSTDEEQRAASLGKGTNIEPQQKMRQWHWNSFLVENKDGSTGELHDMGKAMLKNLTMLEVKQTNRSRKDLINRLHERLGEIRNYAEEVGGDQQKTIEEFAKQIEELKGTRAAETLGEKKASGLLDQFGRPIK